MRTLFFLASILMTLIMSTLMVVQAQESNSRASVVQTAVSSLPAMTVQPAVAMPASTTRDLETAAALPTTANALPIVGLATMAGLAVGLWLSGPRRG